MTEFAHHQPQDLLQLAQGYTIRYPEIALLIDAGQPAFSDISDQTDNASVAAQLYPEASEQRLEEMNRVVVGLAAMDWLLDGDYAALTACQQGRSDRLTRDSFDELKAYIEGVLVSEDAKDAMRVSLIIDGVVRLGGTADRIVEFPGSLPSFDRLTPHYKELVRERLRRQFDLGQFMHGESVPASLAELQGLNEETVRFYNLQSFLNIAGNAGHIRQDGSAIIDESTYQSFRMAATALEGTGGTSPVGAYDAYLRQKADQLEMPDIDDPASRAITRICCMLGFSSPEHAAGVANVFNRLPDGTRAILEHELARTGVDDGYATLIDSAAAIMTNLQYVYGEWAANGYLASDEAFKRAVFTGCTTLGQLYMQSRVSLKGQDGNGVFAVLAAEVAATAAASPEQLQQDPVMIARIADTNSAIARVEPLAKIETNGFDDLRLEQLPGKRVVVMGMGGGSDVVQAAIMAKLLEKAGKECTGIVSVRGSAHGISGHGGQITDGVYVTTPSTTLDTRYFEDLPPREGYKTVLVVNDRDEYNLEQQVQAVIDTFGADMVLAIDTGGDALYYGEAAEGTDPSVASPDQDQRVLAALRSVTGVRQYTAIFGTGIDAPPYALSVLRDAKASTYTPDEAELRVILDQYASWGLPSSDSKRFAKTLPVVHAALRGVRGLFESPIPAERILDHSNPWNPYSHIQDAASHLFVMDAEEHRRAIHL